MSEENKYKQVKEYLEKPAVILERRLWNSVQYLGNIELFVFARLGLTWEQVVLYNPKFDSYRTSNEYEEMVAFVNSESDEYFKVKNKFMKIISMLDNACKEINSERSDFKKIE